MIFLALLAIFVAAEVSLVLIVRRQRQSFPWIITEQDECPVFDEDALDKFLDSSFDPHLGWVRKANTSGIEKGKKGLITYHVDSLGSRDNSFKQSEYAVAAFGDSYVFCRQVEDDETWEAVLSQEGNFGVLNFGVGNYGVDQALLRYEGTNLPDSVKVVVMGFVPETICRIQSYWKHYLEFGNTFAFKPRFVVDKNDQLALLENCIRSAEDFASYREKLQTIRQRDAFYETKFRFQQFRFPYVFSLMREPLKKITLMCAIAIRGFARAWGITNKKIEDMPFTMVMKNNIRDAYRHYGDVKATKLLSAILLKFRDEATRRGHLPLVVVLPQLLDLKINNKNSAPYQDYFREIGHQLPVLDFTTLFMGSDHEALYVNDQYGGHPSVDGNRLIAREILGWLRSNTKLSNP